MLWNWELDKTQYNGWDEMLLELQKTDTRVVLLSSMSDSHALIFFVQKVMTYVNPYLYAEVNG